MPAIGSYRHHVAVEGPGAAIPDGDGGWTSGFGPLDPPDWYCSIQSANQKDLEQIGAGSVLSMATHIVRGRYHAGVTTQSRIVWGARLLNVVYVANRDERGIELDLICAEVVE